MAAPTLIRRELSAAFISFIRAGEVVDSVTVAIATWPDNDPATNWTAFAFADIETVIENRKQVDEAIMIPSVSGGYVEDDEVMVTREAWTCTTAKTNSLVKELQFGVASAIAASTAQAPSTKNDRYIDGVLLLEVKNKSGAIIERMQRWARMRLINPGDIGPATKKVQIEFRGIYSPNNTVITFA